MLLQAFLVGLAAAIGQSDYLLGTAMVERPIVLGAIVGIFWLFGGFCGRDSGIGPAQRAKTTIWN